MSTKLAPGQTLAYSLQGAANAPATVDGSTVTYPQALPQTDLKLDLTGDGVKESLVLHSPDAANSWVFPLHLHGLTARLVDGSVEYLDAKGAVVSTTPAPPGRRGCRSTERVRSSPASLLLGAFLQVDLVALLMQAQDATTSRSSSWPGSASAGSPRVRGRALVVDALRRIASASKVIGVRALLIHCETEAARDFALRLVRFDAGSTDPMHLPLM